MSYILGIDLGTSSVKSTAFSETGKIVAFAAKEYTYDAEKPGFAEQDPEVWWNATAYIIQELIVKGGIDTKEIVGIGLSGQMHGMVALDKYGIVVRKAILHCDVRAVDIVAEIAQKTGKESFYEITYNPVFSGFQLVSLLWMKKHEANNFDKIDKVFCPKDYIRYRLTGLIGTEATDASGTLAYNVCQQKWSSELMEQYELPQTFFPSAESSPHEIAGEISKEAAKKTGLQEGTPVMYGGSDQSMHSLGNGLFKKSELMVTIGTSGQVLMLGNRPVKNPKMNTHTFRHIEKNVWFGLGACLHAGVTLNWFKRTFAPELSYDDLSNMAMQAKPCCDGLVFFPAFAGERTPYADMDTRGIFLGFTMAHKKEDFARAIMEGVTMELKSSIGILQDLYGMPSKIICAGGGVKSAVWSQMQADIFASEIHVSRILEQGCLGAAITAGVGVGLFKNITEGFEGMTAGERTVLEPIAENVKKYDSFYRDIFLKLYEKNSEIFKETWKY